MFINKTKQHSSLSNFHIMNSKFKNCKVILHKNHQFQNKTNKIIQSYDFVPQIQQFYKIVQKLKPQIQSKSLQHLNQIIMLHIKKILVKKNLFHLIGRNI
ncbi:unnamed protein product [Paramecium sonneborni]|uniref:Uncharacterized protein n=1 Tax=Paramecium sonneborni TaxID=65129 RepID=A0A8S1N7A1_9CILI|nr:unnamed protein product [Paramecium sonneborni]CAD8086963.1 unnamed protein product [Paramecium sonneborni]